MQTILMLLLAILNVTAGSNNATLTLAIQADDVPEIAETFQVELLSVDESNQRISQTEVSSCYLNDHSNISNPTM